MALSPSSTLPVVLTVKLLLELPEPKYTPGGLTSEVLSITPACAAPIKPNDATVASKIVLGFFIGDSWGLIAINHAKPVPTYISGVNSVGCINVPSMLTQEM